MASDANHAHNIGHRPRPVATDSTRPFWTAALANELSLPRCAKCDVIYYPPPPRCPRCLGDRFDWISLSRRGRIAGMTTVHLATIPGVEPPFTMVEIELVEQKGLILTTLLTSEKPAQASVGDPVILEFTEPDPRGVAYPQARATAEVQP